MKCPACAQRVLSFGRWGAGMNAFRRLPCPRCGAALAPSRRTKVLFAVFVGVLPFYVLGMLLLREQFASGALRDLLFGIAILLLIFVACYWVWHTGSYALDPYPETAHRPTRRVVWNILGIVFVVCLLVWMVPDAYSNAVLLFDGRDAVARVVRTERESGEIRVHYEFVDELVKMHRGVATFALKNPPTDDRFLHIVYWPRDPTVSMLQSRSTYMNLLPAIL